MEQKEKPLSKQNFPPSVEEAVNQMLPLVKSLARKYLSPHQNLVTHEDLVSAGIIGLIKAYRQFDPSKHENVKFKTYAYYRIKGEMFDELRKFFKTRDKNKKNGEKSKRKKRLIPISSFKNEDLKEDREEDFTLFANNYFAEDTFSLYVSKEVEKKLKRSLEVLNEKERFVIEMHYYENLELKDVARRLNLTPPRVSQIHREAVEKIKAYLNGIVTFDLFQIKFK